MTAETTEPTRSTWTVRTERVAADCSNEILWGFKIWNNLGRPTQRLVATSTRKYRNRDDARSAGQDAWLHLLTGHADELGVGDDYTIL